MAATSMAVNCFVFKYWYSYTEQHQKRGGEAEEDRRMTEHAAWRIVKIPDHDRATTLIHVQLLSPSMDETRARNVRTVARVRVYVQGGEGQLVCVRNEPLSNVCSSTTRRSTRYHMLQLLHVYTMKAVRMILCLIPGFCF